MQNIVRITVAVIILLAILAFMMTYTVRFTETAVVTTFGRADDGAVRTTAGLGFKWPYPIQSVTKYDTRARYVEARSETIGTADNRQLIITAFLTWQVDSPLKFFELYGNSGSRATDHFRAADETIKRVLRGSLAEISRFNLSDLLSIDAKGDQLAKLESAMLENIQKQMAGTGGAAAVKPINVGIAAVRLPEGTTKTVIDQMQQVRSQLASEAIASGRSAAEAIKTQAINDAKKILSFAERRASVIRSQGDQEAAKYYEQQNTDPDLAVFLRNLDFMKNALSKRTTLVLSLAEPGLGLFRPGAVLGLPPGTVPPFQADPAKPAIVTPEVKK